MNRVICRILDLEVQKHYLSPDLDAKEGKWGIRTIQGCIEMLCLDFCNLLVYT